MKDRGPRTVEIHSNLQPRPPLVAQGGSALHTARRSHGQARLSVRNFVDELHPGFRWRVAHPKLEIKIDIHLDRDSPSACGMTSAIAGSLATYTRRLSSSSMPLGQQGCVRSRRASQLTRRGRASPSLLPAPQSRCTPAPLLDRSPSTEPESSAGQHRHRSWCTIRCPTPAQYSEPGVTKATRLSRRYEIPFAGLSRG